jgi:anti-sigma factor (TIGR02949 family)
VTIESRRSECEEIVRRLWPYIDGRLPDSERERVTSHLEGCVACASHFDFAAAFLEAVHAARPAEREDEDLRIRVLSALGSEGFSLE